MKLGNISVGKDCPTFVIAEIGINHNGNVNLAKKLILTAKECGANCVKFQKRVVTDSFTQKKLEEPYETKNSYGKTYGLHKNHLELSNESYRELKRYADELDILFIATPCDIASVDFLDSINVPFFKVASGDLRNRPLIEHIASKEKPMIISTGMSNLETILEVYDYLSKLCKDLVVLSCTSSYPTPLNEVNLNVIKTLQEKLPKAVIGYSGHEKGIVITLAAVAMGASVIERHFTLDKSMRGSDHCCSLEPVELDELIGNIRKVETATGSYVKEVRESEKKFMSKLTKSLVSTRFIPAGTVITREMLTTKHPGSGISPMKIYETIGKRAMVDIEEDMVLFENQVR